MDNVTATEFEAQLGNSRIFNSILVSCFKRYYKSDGVINQTEINQTSKCVKKSSHAFAAFYSGAKDAPFPYTFEAAEDADGGEE